MTGPAASPSAVVGGRNERHHVELYSADEPFIERLADYVSTGLVAREPVIVIATPEHRQQLSVQLRLRGIDVDEVTSRGVFAPLDASDMLDRFLVGGVPERQRFEAAIRPMLEKATALAGGRLVRAFGEMVDLLWKRGAGDAAILLEELWEQLAKQHAFGLLCAYRIDGTPPLDFVRRIYQVHRRINHNIPEAEDFRLLVESVRDYAIFMLDTEGRVISWNPGAERLKGYRAEDIIGEHFSRFYPEEDVRAGKCARELELSLELGRFEDEGWRVRQDGSRFWANVIITAMRDRRGNHIGFAKVTRDLSERMRAQEQLREEQVARARADAERLASEERLRLGELFAGILAHDLRNPLSSIVTAAELTKRQASDERSARTQTRILSSADRMKRMIDQLLDFTRVRMGGGLEVVRGSFDLGDLVKELVRETEQSSGREFQVDQRGDLAGAWDRDRLGQVLSNLLTNAADHGLPERPIRVRVDGTEPARVTIETNNLGQIPSDLLPTLFEPFRVGAAHRPMGRGLGLGLFIAREVVRLHGGGICVFSTAEEGTTFQVELPRSIS